MFFKNARKTYCLRKVTARNLEIKIAEVKQKQEIEKVYVSDAVWDSLPHIILGIQIMAGSGMHRTEVVFQ